MTNLYVPFRILVIILREVPDVHYHRALDLQQVLIVSIFFKSPGLDEILDIFS